MSRRLTQRTQRPPRNNKTRALQYHERQYHWWKHAVEKAGGTVNVHPVLSERDPEMARERMRQAVAICELHKLNASRSGRLISKGYL